LAIIFEPETLGKKPTPLMMPLTKKTKNLF